MRIFLIVSTCLLMLLTGFQLKAQDDDPYLWLEDVQGEKALEWVKKQNADSIARLEKVPGFKKANEKILEILNSSDRIPYAGKRGDYFYNFWQDEQHPRGIYRRTTLEEYMKENPKWETILDVDALAKEEGKSWVFHGIDALYPDYTHWLITLSPGGSDAAVVREFDINTKSFVKNGFQLPEAKSNISWRDIDTVYVGTDFGEGSLTKSGYPRIVKLWKRGTPLKDAETIYEADENSVSVVGGRWFSDDGNLDFIVNRKTFYTNDFFLIQEGKLVKMAIPQDAMPTGYFKKQLLIRLRNDWKVGDQTYKQGSVIIGKVDDIMAGKMNFHILMEPSERLSIASVNTTKSTILVTVLDNVISKLFQFTLDENGKWVKKQVKMEFGGTLNVFNTNEKSDDYFITYQSFLTPDSLYMVSAKDGKIAKLKSAPSFFNAEPYKAQQYEAVSADGTKIPYFIIMRKDTKFNGNNPTLLYGYGGFRIPMRPRYSAAVGNCWLGEGGVYVLANIRGGGEFGPAWHQAALLKNRRKAFEDFIAVSEDLIKRKITSPEKLAIQGGSNGGLLVGAVFVMRPDLFKAVICQVPLLDMKRYNKLLAGASWMAEYGNPDEPEMWEYIKTYSPYQNVKKDVKYPLVFFTTSTKDDRVHPGHARKMVAKMKDMGHDVLYYENIEGGHSTAADNKQRAYMNALAYAHLYHMLMGK